MDSTSTVKVWDIAVRIFHWSLVAGFFLSWATAEAEDIHVILGYIVLGLISFRLLWGFIGTRHARFSDFLYSPRAAIDYLKSLAEGSPKHYLGHNPAGSYMIYALLFCLFALSFTGLKLLAIEEGEGPFAATPAIEIVATAHASDDEHEVDEQAEEFWEEIHETLTHLTFVLILLHVAGVIVGSKADGENLVKAMITGRKRP